MSPSLLSRRLQELEQAGIVARVSAEGEGHDEYLLTEAGQELRPIIKMLGVWGKRWVRGGMEEEHLDAGLLMWDLRRRIQVDQAPPGRTVVCFHFLDLPDDQNQYWVIVDAEEVDLCVRDPGHPVDLEVETDLATMTGVWRGDVRYAEALRRREVRLRGPAKLRRSFPKWLGFSLFADVEMPASS